MRTTVRFWRFRRNPLKRGTDRVEAWSLAVLTAALAVGAPLAGAATGLGVAAAAHPPTGWHTTSAALTRRAPPSFTGDGLTSGTAAVRVDVHWTTADGRVHHGLASVSPNSAAGTRITIWLDASGSLRGAPLDPTAVRGRALTSGICAATGTVVLAGGGWIVVRRSLDRRRAADLDREWARIGPQWGTAARG